MKKRGFIIGLIFVSLFFFSQAAFPWGSAVHTYIDGKIGTNSSFLNLNEMYGGMGPDVFNYRFDQPNYMSFLYVKTHYDFMKFWNEAHNLPEKALGLGFVSHNNLWGADYTAHTSGLTFGQGKGYVIAKAELLAVILNSVPEYHMLGIPEAITMEIAHTLVEDAVDILIKNVDPHIGQKMIAAVITPHPNFLLLLQKAYSQDLSSFAGITMAEAGAFIKASETQFRTTTALYGLALMQPDALQLIAEQMAEFAQTFLAAYGITPPPTDILTPLAEAGIFNAMILCSGDYEKEIGATIRFVQKQLRLHRITY
jgi:hypothetical protein